MPEYVYGIVEAGHTGPDKPGIAGAAVRVLDHGKVAALISELRNQEPELGRDELLVHASVLEAALAGGTVLPMRFGTVMNDADDVKARLLEPNASELQSELQRLNGKVELRIRAVYDQPTLLREIVAEDSEIAQLRKSLQGVSKDATYYEQIRLGELVSQAIEHKRETDANGFVDALAPVAEEIDISDVSHERVALNASFLVDRKRVPEFDAELERIAKAQADRLRVKYTGPLPPHSFVELQTAS